MHNPGFHAERRLVAVILENVIDVLFIAWKRITACRADHAVCHDLYWWDWYKMKKEVN